MFGNRELLKVLRKFLKMMYEQTLPESYQGKQSLNSLEKAYHGKQSLKDLYAKETSLSSIELTGDIKTFDRVAKDYGIDYSIKRIEKSPPKYAAFFKSRDADVMQQIFNTYAGQKIRNTEKPSKPLSHNKFKSIWGSIKGNISRMVKPRAQVNKRGKETTLYLGSQSVSKDTSIAPKVNTVASDSTISNEVKSGSIGKDKADWISSVEVTNDNIKSFDAVAKKYGIEYSLKRINGDPPTHIVFFKCKDAETLNKGFKEYVKSQSVKKMEKPSLREKIKKFMEIAKEQVTSKTRKKEQGLEL